MVRQWKKWRVTGTYVGKLVSYPPLFLWEFALNRKKGFEEGLEPYDYRANQKESQKALCANRLKEEG
jgi:hypothetical protein